jgi:hypothetical protein
MTWPQSPHQPLMHPPVFERIVNIVQLSKLKFEPLGPGSGQVQSRPRAAQERTLFGDVYFLQMFTSILQFLGEHYPATGQGPVIFF